MPNEQERQVLREEVRRAVEAFDGAYWREVDRAAAYPEAFVERLTELGYLAALVPPEYGGAGLGIGEASVILEEIHRSGGNAAACHAQMYTMGTVLRHGSEELKARYLPDIAKGTLRLQAFGVTEPDAGSDTTRISTRATRVGDEYVINGQKTFISRVEFSDLLLLLARSTPAGESEHRTDGLSVFLVDLREAGEGVTWQRIPLMFNHHSYQVFLTDLHVPASGLVGEEGKGFRYIIDGWNAERCLIASEAIGDGRFFVNRAAAYASTRQVFGRMIGENQGVQFPIAAAHAEVEAAALMRDRAAELFDAGRPCGPEANMAKLLASRASRQAGEAAVTAFGGSAFMVENDIERKLRETNLFEVAPVSNNLVLAYLGQNVLGMPRSY
ncbi:MAG TPA: acyl-CoA dehydrogenase family protein [Acidimicrobiales bacterium]|nr:acyl-CoA dehydrogenase family protein [Acidimicrobiales bacterium]